MSETPLEKLIATICDTADYTDAEIREELAEAGIDLDAEKAKFLPKLDAMMAARAGRRAIEALKIWPTPAQGDLLPWAASESPDFPEAADLVTANGGLVATLLWPVNAAHIAAAVNAAPHLLARVAELEAEKETLQARFDDLLSAAQEVAEVARLRGEGYLNPEDDPVLWTSRWNEALANLAEEVEK